MKKILAVTVVFALGLAVSAFAADSNVQVKEKSKTVGGTTTTTTEVKDTTTGATAKEKVVTTDTTLRSAQDIKGENLSMKKKEIITPALDAGKAKIDVKKGAITDMQIEWIYRQEGSDYVTEYQIKDKTNPALLKELNLTPVQAALIQPGVHKVVSTSPYTGEDVRNIIRSVIIKDLKASLTKK